MERLWKRQSITIIRISFNSDRAGTVGKEYRGGGAAQGDWHLILNVCVYEEHGAGVTCPIKRRMLGRFRRRGGSQEIMALKLLMSERGSSEPMKGLNATQHGAKEA